MKLVIFGCGNIANRIAKACRQVEEIDLVGFASKDPEKAKAYAQTYGCREYGDYEYFLNSDVDAVYIAAYNPGHYELIRTCLEHHKHVICEKPMLSTIRETDEAFELARQNDVLLMEALKSVFLPIILKTRQLIREETFGKITEIYASFMRAGHHPESHWINDPGTGGAFRDLGSYCIGTMNFLLDGPPELIKLESDRTAARAETTAYADLDYHGIHGRACVSNTLDGDQTLIITGERGYLQIDDFWKTGNGCYVTDGEKHLLQEELISDFYYELKHFANLVHAGRKESPVMSQQASDDILKITGSI